MNSNKEVQIDPPSTVADTGFVFNEWDVDTTTPQKYTDEVTTVTGTFQALEDIYPKFDGETENAKPKGYVTVTFDGGDHGSLAGETVYYLNPNKNIRLGNENIVKPTVTPEAGFTHTGWDVADTEPITKNLTVTAQYEALDDVIYGVDPDTGINNEKPEGYVTITFSPEENGKLMGQEVFYVNPTKVVVLDDYAPKVVPNTGYTFGSWDTPISFGIVYTKDHTIKAQYNELDDVYDKETTGYIKVEFKAGENGKLEGATHYWVKPGVEVKLPEPIVKPKNGYKFTEWDKATTVTLEVDAETYVITAEYEELPKIVEGDLEKPENYVTITFVADENGRLEGTTKYYVNPDVEVDLTEKANAIKKFANTGYTAKGGSFDKELVGTFTKDTEFTFSFVKLEDIYLVGEDTAKPEGYVTVKFSARTHGSLVDGDVTYYVNPLAKVRLSKTATVLGEKVIPVPQTESDINYIFDLWVEAIDETNSITGDRNHVAIFIPTNIPEKNPLIPLDSDLEVGDLIELTDGQTATFVGTPVVNELGKQTAKIKINEDGNTYEITMPYTVVDHVVKQDGETKPLVPENYVKVVVDQQ